MSAIIGIFEGGTTGLQDGTLISRDDAETNAYAFAALDTEYTLHYRVIESSTGAAAYYQTTAAFTVTAPTGVQVSAESGTGYGSSDTFPAATPYNQPLYIQQTDSAAAAEADLEVGTSGVVFEAYTWPYAWSDDFGDASLDTDKWTIMANSAAGMVTESSGVLRVYSATGADKGGVYADNYLYNNIDSTLTVNGVLDGGISLANVVYISDALVTDVLATGNPCLVVSIYGGTTTTYAGMVVISYWDTSGTRYYWDESDSTWKSAPVDFRWDINLATGSAYTVEVTIDAGGNYGITVTNDSTSDSVSCSIAISSVRAAAADNKLGLSLMDAAASVLDLKWSNVSYAAGV